MSVPFWLLDAINSGEQTTVPNVPNPGNLNWVQVDNITTQVNRGLAGFVPSVPSVPKEIQLTSKEVGIVVTEVECRHAAVRALLIDRRYALLVQDESTDPVLVTVGIQNIATFEMAIPKHSYDSILLLDLIEKHLEVAMET